MYQHLISFESLLYSRSRTFHPPILILKQYARRKSTLNFVCYFIFCRKKTLFLTRIVFGFILVEQLTTAGKYKLNLGIFIRMTELIAKTKSKGFCAVSHL